MTFSPLEVPALDEGSAVVQSSALERIRKLSKEVVVIHYPHRGYGGTASDDTDSLVEKSGKFTILNKLLELYTTGTPISIKQDYIPSGSEASHHIMIVDSVGCDIEAAEMFIGAVVETIRLTKHPPNPPTNSSPNPLSALDRSRPYYHHKDNSAVLPKNFITRVSLCTSTAPKKFLTLFVSIPYLGIGSKVSISGSWTLRQFRSKTPPPETPKPDVNNQILVHQTWFLVFSNETIGIFRSADDSNNDRAPLVSYQQREGAFQVLVHMISNMLTSSETQVLRHFRALVTNWELEHSESDKLNQELDKGPTPRTAELGSYIIDLYTMVQVVRYQIKYLKDLRQIFQTSHSLNLGPRAEYNQFEIPYIENQKEKMRSVIKSITSVLAEREKFHEERVKELEHLRTLFLGRAQTTTTTIVTVTAEECFKHFRKYIDGENRSLDIFYKDDESLKKHAPTAKIMVEKLFALGCKKEIALHLSTLILYDMVMLIDDSSSMETEQGGERIETLKRTMDEITAIYDLANPTGIRAIKFLNAKQGLLNVRNKSWKRNFKRLKYDGMTRIGTALKAKILAQFVWKTAMTKPLLVMIITDGDAEGEREGMLEDVIRKCVADLEADTARGKGAVSFHFSRVGNDLSAQALLEKLENSSSVGDNVDCLGVHGSLEKLSDPEGRYKWAVLPKLLLGGIMRMWSEIDEEPEITLLTGPDEPRIDEEEDVETGSDSEDN